MVKGVFVVPLRMTKRWEFPVHKGFHAGPSDEPVLRDLAELEEITGESTSEVMKRAIRMYLAVESVVIEQELDFPEPSKRHFVKQSMRNEILREFVND